MPTSTKPHAWKLRESIMAATVAHSAIIVFWKETAFPCYYYYYYAVDDAR